MIRVPKMVIKNWKVALAYSVVALIILWPLLGSGFILTLDMVFTPNLAMPDTLSASYLFHTGLHLLNFVLPSDVIEKLILFAILLLSGLGMHRLMRSLQVAKTPALSSIWASYASGLLYMINPFVYSRFMAGQYSVLLGYALIPFFIVALLRFLNKLSTGKTIALIAVSVVISIVSIHTLGLLFIVTLVAIAQTAQHYRKQAERLKQLAKYSLLAVLAFIILSSYWLLPLMQGSGTTAASITTFQSSDQSEFATGGEGVGGKLIHILRLQGFWGERNNLFLLPQDELKTWGIVVTIIWVLVIIGIVTAWRQKRTSGILFTGSMIIAALLAAGVGTTWLAAHVPFFAGYREPQKFVALVALSYAVFVGFAIPGILEKIHSKVGRLILGCVLVLTLVGFTPVMFRGFDGQLVPRQYPADWYVVNQQLNEDHGTYQVLFLPWHLYMRYQFAGRLIASPIDSFFTKPFLVSDNPELGAVGPAVANAQKQLLTSRILPQASTFNTLGQQLIPLGVKYVLLAKESDYLTYSYLDRQTDLQLVSESATLKLYRVTTFEKGEK